MIDEASGIHIVNELTDDGAERPSERIAFRGTYTHTVDGKGRVSVPVEYRKSLGQIGDASLTDGSTECLQTDGAVQKQPIILTNMLSGGARCLEGYALSAWREFEEKLRAKSRFDPKVQQLEMFYIGRAVECEIDGSGRIMVPQNLRAYAGIEKDVVFSGSIHGFKLWDKRVWEHLFAAAESALMTDPELFVGLDL